MEGGGGGGTGEVQEGVKFTVITEWPKFMVRPEVGGQAENMGRVVFSIVAPTCSSFGYYIFVKVIISQ